MLKKLIFSENALTAYSLISRLLLLLLLPRLQLLQTTLKHNGKCDHSQNSLSSRYRSTTSSILTYTFRIPFEVVMDEILSLHCKLMFCYLMYVILWLNIFIFQNSQHQCIKHVAFKSFSSVCTFVLCEYNLAFCKNVTIPD